MRRLARRARGQRALDQLDVVVGAFEGAEHAAVLARGRSGRAGAGSASRRSATLISCMPRQMPSTRQVALDRARASARFRSASRSGTVSTVSRVRALRRRRDGSMSAPPARISPSSSAEQLLGVLDQLLVGRQHQRQPAGALHGVDVVASAAARRRWSHTLQRAARARCRCRSRVVPSRYTIGSTLAGARSRPAETAARRRLPHDERSAMSEPDTQLETVNLTIDDGGRDDRAQPPRRRSTPGTASSATTCSRRVARCREDDAVRAVLDHRRRARLLLGRRPEGPRRRRTTARRGARTSTGS